MSKAYYRRPTKLQVAPAQVQKHCEYCKTEFWITRSYADDYVFCSKSCRLKAQQAKNAYAKAAEMVKLSDDAKAIGTLILDNRPITRQLSVLTPQYSSMLRGKIASMVHDHLLVAEKVLTGEIAWTNAQISLFKTLLAKVVPDVSATYHQHELNSRTTTEMTREELEALASSQATGAIIDHQEQAEGRPTDLNDPSGVRPGYVRPGPVIYPRREAPSRSDGPPGQDHDHEDP